MQSMDMTREISKYDMGNDQAIQTIYAIKKVTIDLTPWA
jgi:hypothetical protein